MNLFKLVGISALFLIAGCAASVAQNVVSPGELPGPPNGALLRSSFLPAGSTPTVSPKLKIGSFEDSHTRRVRAIWVASIFAMVAGTTADAVTSWHKRESNNLLASSADTFGGKGVAIKGGIAAAMLAPQIIFRKHTDWYSAFAVGNFAEGGIFAGATIHNLNVNSSAK
jgi:hypothetical protein